MAKIRLSDKTLRRAPPPTGQTELWDDLVPGFGLRIAAGGSRTYFVMKRLNGKLVRRTVGKVAPPDGPLAPGELDLANAREHARKLLSDLARGIDPDAVKAAAKTAPAKTPNTFGEVAASYFKDPAKRGGAGLRSKAELERKVRVDLAAWKDRPIAEITRADIRTVINAKHAAAPVSANRLLALVRRIFRWAVREEVLTANPAMDIEPTGEQERERVLTMSELAQVWAGAQAMGYPYGPLIELLVLTAQRRSEVAGLRWSEIDGKDWRLPDDRAKRGKGHLVPLSPRAMSILEGLPKMGDKPSLVFTTGKRAAKKGERVDPKAPPAPVSGWSRMKDRLDWIVALQAAPDAEPPKPADAGNLSTKQQRERHAEAIAKWRREITEAHGLPAWTLHDIRRSVATHLRSVGTDRLTVSKILNHAEGGMTRLYDRYHSDPEKRAALEAWALVVERQCGLNVVALQGLRG